MNAFQGDSGASRSTARDVEENPRELYGRRREESVKSRE